MTPSTPSGSSPLTYVLVALVVAAGLSTDRLVGAAERLPYGTTRSVLVGATGALDTVASGVGLDQPGRLVDELAGRGPEPEPGPTELAAAPGTGTGRATTREPGPTPSGQPLGPQAAPVSTGPSSGGPTTMVTDQLDPGPGSAGAGATPTSPPPTGPTPSGPTDPDGPGLDRPNPTQAAVGGAAAAGIQNPALLTQPRPVDPEAKLRLWAGGDSLGEYVGNQLLFPLADTEVTSVALDYRISTGLARPDFFDWQAEIQALMATEAPPEALVFMVGGNDDQNMLASDTVVDVGSAAWAAEYRRRAAAFMDATATGSSHLYWIGLPPMQEDRRETISITINDILASEAADRPWVTYVDIHPLFAGPDGGYQSHRPDRAGDQRLVRASDGVHITYEGSGWVAEQLWDDIRRLWALSAVAPPAALEPAPGS